VKPAGILIVSPGGVTGRGGISRSVNYLTAEFNRTFPGQPFTVVSSWDDKVFFINILIFFRAFLTVFYYLLTRRISLAHIHFSGGGSTLRKLSLFWLVKLFRVPVIMHLHSGLYHTFYRSLSRTWQDWIRKSLTAADKVFVLGQTWKEFACNEIGLPEGNIEIVPNGVPALKGEVIEDTEKPPLMVFLGRLENEKGVPELMKALASEAVRTLPWNAVLAGNGEVDRFRIIAAEFGLSDRISFPGWVESDEVKRFLLQADIMLLPSHMEGLPMAILEAMSCGKAIIATPVGSIPEYVEDGVAGIIVPCEDDKALSRAIEKVLRDRGLRKELGVAAKKIFDEKLEIGSVAARVMKHYEMVLRDKG